jgi:hypothetical protein
MTAIYDSSRCLVFGASTATTLHYAIIGRRFVQKMQRTVVAPASTIWT